MPHLSHPSLPPRPPESGREHRRHARRRAAEAWFVASVAGVVVTVAEVPLGLRLDWWDYEDVSGALNLALALLLLACAGRLPRLGRVAGEAAARPAGLAIFFALGAVLSWAGRLAIAFDLVFAGFSARTTLQVLGGLFVLGAFVMAALALVRALPPRPADPVAARGGWAIGLLLIGACFALILALAGGSLAGSFGGAPAAIAAAPIAAGLTSLAAACSAARRAIIDDVDVSEVF